MLTAKQLLIIYKKANIHKGNNMSINGNPHFMNSKSNNIPTTEWLSSNEKNQSNSFPLVGTESVSRIVFDETEHSVVHIATADLCKDIERVTCRKNTAINVLPTKTVETAVLVGTLGQSSIAEKILSAGQIDEADQLKGMWEGYLVKVIQNPMPNVTRSCHTWQ